MYNPQSQQSQEPMQGQPPFQYQQQPMQGQQPPFQYQQQPMQGQPPFQYQQQPMQGQPFANPYQQWQVQAQFTKSYTTPAVITLVLYIFMWIPGLIANVIYLIEANKTKQITGTTPDGYGCLVALLCAVAAPGLLGGIVLMMILFAAAVGH